MIKTLSDKGAGMAGVRVNGDRLWGRLMEMAEIGATPKGGVCRLALTELDRRSRELFKLWCVSAGCSVTIDTMGNMFARRPGTVPDAQPIATGSHLDSQPTGGKFDGVLGVLAGLEVIETLNDSGIETKAPIEVIVWTNEEGARFAPAMIGSGVYAGEFKQDDAYRCADDKGVTIRDALKSIGYLGTEDCGHRSVGAHYELHIEQGPILETENTEIGIVTGVQGIRWYELTVTGAETHAGPAPMSMRADPVPKIIDILQALYGLTEQLGPDARCTIGRLNAAPGSTNTVPGRVTASIDIRHPEPSGLAFLDEKLRALAANVSHGCAATLVDIWHSPPVAFHQDCIATVVAAADAVGATSRRILSGAGHDSVYVARRAPTSMIFIPCKDGVSHNEAESTLPEQVEMGANVLLHTLLAHANT